MATPPATGPTLSQDQQTAHDAIVAWYSERKRPLMTLGGYAGSGKTFLTAQIAATLRRQNPRLKIGFVCFTGKASTILKAKLEKAKALRDDYCGTIHALIYKAVTDGRGRVIRWERVHRLDEGLLILDEASMVDELLFKDLQSYSVPILAVGDHGQLPPIKGTLNLMASPELRLDRIHRQAADNPIIRASMQIRETGHLPYCDWDGKVRKIGSSSGVLEDMAERGELAETLFLCGTNKTRVALNAKIRRLLRKGTHDEPIAGDRVICLKNNRKKGLFNGLTGVITAIEPRFDHWYDADITMDGGETFSDRVCRYQFGCSTTLRGGEIEELSDLDPREYGELFDYGYAMTVHKAQGSEAKSVVVFDECDWMKTEDERRRWKYTAITRASEKLLIIGR